MTVGRKWLIGLVVAAVFAGLLLRYLERVPRRHYCDFRVYHHAAQDILAGKDIYTRETMEITPFKYSPFFAFLFVPFGAMPIKVAAAVFFTINVLLTVALFRLAVGVVGAHKISPPEPRRYLWVLYGISALFLSRFVLAVWDSGQVTIMMCAFVLAGLSLLSRHKEMPAAAFLAAALLIKYTPAIFLPYFIVRRQFKVVAWTIVFSLVWLMLPALAVGLQKNLAYLSSWIPSIIETSLDPGSYIDTKNQSLFSLVLRSFSDTGFNINITHLTFRQGQLAGYGLAAVLYALVLLPPSGKPRNQGIDYALLFCFLPLFNPNGWLINFVALAVPVVFLVERVVALRGKDMFTAVCVAGAFCLQSLMAQDLVGNDWQNRGELFSNVTWGSLLLVTALLRLKFEPVSLAGRAPVSVAAPRQASR